MGSTQSRFQSSEAQRQLEAKTIFRDENLFTFPDEENSDIEERLISIGISDALRILLVVHTENERRGDELVVRLISARKGNAGRDRNI